MQLSEKMDAGPLYTQETVPLSGNETKQALADKLAESVLKCCCSTLPGIMDGSLQPKPQDETAAAMMPHIKKADGRIDWSKPAAHLEREVRAYSGWPRSRTPGLARVTSSSPSPSPLKDQLRLAPLKLTIRNSGVLRRRPADD